MMQTEPPPAYPGDGANTMAGSEEVNIKHPYNFHFSEETVRKGLFSTLTKFLIIKMSNYNELNF